jgi:hypothetical protein
MWDKILNPCYGKFEYAACRAWTRSLDAMEITLAIICVMVVVFILFRIWFWAIGDLEVW